MSVTFALLCYNQEKFIREAIRGALAQDFHPLEILVSDDYSTDATFDIVKDEVAGYAGPHTIRLHRNSENIGFENFARTAEMARGEFLVSAHGDDVSYPGRTRALVEAWRATNASLLSSNAEVIDEQSHVLRLMTPRSEPKWIQSADFAKHGYVLEADGATLAWHRDVFAKFGRLDGSRLRAAYDHVLPFRAALLAGVYYLPSPQLRRRTHGANYGLECADRTQGDLVKRETMAAYDIGAKLCMLEDLDYYLERNPGAAAEHIALRDVLTAAILTIARRANVARNELFAQGLRPTWINRIEMVRREDYAKGYLEKKKASGLKAGLKRLRKSAGALKRLVAE